MLSPLSRLFSLCGSAVLSAQGLLMTGHCHLKPGTEHMSCILVQWLTLLAHSALQRFQPGCTLEHCRGENTAFPPSPQSTGRNEFLRSLSHSSLTKGNIDSGHSEASLNSYNRWFKSEKSSVLILSTKCDFSLSELWFFFFKSSGWKYLSIYLYYFVIECIDTFWGSTYYFWLAYSSKHHMFTLKVIFKANWPTNRNIHNLSSRFLIKWLHFLFWSRSANCSLLRRSEHLMMCAHCVLDSRVRTCKHYLI